MAANDSMDATVNRLHQQVQDFDSTWWTLEGVPRHQLAQRLDEIHTTVSTLLAQARRLQNTLS